ncbi:hypothetical protein AYO38_09950 [bacterium SCGC AG-212-C10]|nr:hypothetical protein AYO38_09950 [bacterium SCGC AG-212-C10]
MNWISILLIAVAGLLTWRAYSNGFVRELVSFCAVILAVPMAGIFYDDMYPKVHPIVDNENLANLISFLAILAGVVIGGQVVAYLLRRGVSVLNLGTADQLAGGAFGLVKAIILCQVVLIALVAFPSPDLRDEIDGSPVATALLDSTPLLIAILPQHFDSIVDEFLDTANSLDGNDPGRTPTPTP